MLCAARRVEPDRSTKLVHGREEPFELRAVDGLAADVRVDLRADRAEVVDGPLRLGDARIRRRQRRLRHEAREAVGMPGA
jgi:hypothetical protein